MAGGVNVYPSNQLTAYTGVGPSPAIWNSCDVDKIRGNPTFGTIVERYARDCGTVDATSATASGVPGFGSAYLYAGGFVKDGQLAGGSIKIGSDGDNEGAALIAGQAGAFRFVTTSTLAPNKKMWFEAEVALSSIASAHQDAFVGLMKPSATIPVVAQPITTTDNVLMTAGDLFGFQLGGTTSVRGGPTEVAVAFVLASGTVNYPTNMTTLMASTGQAVLAADTFVKLGWIYDPDAATKQITSATARQTAGNKQAAILRVFVNGLELPAFLTSSDVYNATATQAFPTAFMNCVISQMNMASQSSDYLAWKFIRCAQLL